MPLTCTICRGLVIATGDKTIEHEGEWSQGFLTYIPKKVLYKPTFIHPAPPVITIPQPTPDAIREALADAFRMHWVSPSACVTAIRVALELLMDHFGVPRRQKTKKGTFVQRTLHNRIKWFQSNKNTTTGDILMAIKWVGNDGAHTRDSDAGDVLDAFQLMEDALHSIFEPENNTAKKVHKINATKKPISKHRKNR